MLSITNIYYERKVADSAQDSYEWCNSNVKMTKKNIHTLITWTVHVRNIMSSPSDPTFGM